MSDILRYYMKGFSIWKFGVKRQSGRTRPRTRPRAVWNTARAADVIPVPSSNTTLSLNTYSQSQHPGQHLISTSSPNTNPNINDKFQIKQHTKQNTEAGKNKLFFCRVKILRRALTFHSVTRDRES